MDPKDEIQALCGRLVEAHAAMDADAIVACYAREAVIYDLAPPLGRRGIDRGRIAAWLGTWDGHIQIDAADVELVVGDDVAFSTALNRIRGRQGGEDLDIWFRTTMVVRRTADGWRIVHDHSSVPFHMDGSYRAAVDLQP